MPFSYAIIITRCCHTYWYADTLSFSYSIIFRAMPLCCHLRHCHFITLFTHAICHYDIWWHTPMTLTWYCWYYAMTLWYLFRYASPWLYCWCHCHCHYYYLLIFCYCWYHMLCEIIIVSLLISLLLPPLLIISLLILLDAATITLYMLLLRHAACCCHLLPLSLFSLITPPFSHYWLVNIDYLLIRHWYTRLRHYAYYAVTLTLSWHYAAAYWCWLLRFLCHIYKTLLIHYLLLFIILLRLLMLASAMPLRLLHYCLILRHYAAMPLLRRPAPLTLLFIRRCFSLIYWHISRCLYAIIYFTLLLFHYHYAPLRHYCFLKHFR